MRTPNPKALVPGAVVIAVLVVAVVALTAAGGGDGGSATSSSSAVVPPPITITPSAPAPALTASERAGARRDQARERAGHGAGDSDEPDEDLVADAPVTTVETGPTGRGGLGRALPLDTPDGWSLTLLQVDAAAGKTVVSVNRTDGTTTTTTAARKVVRHLALRVGDDPRDYDTTVPMTALKTYRNTPNERQPR